MLVCHCQCITDHDIHAAINWMRAADNKTIITPGKVYRALGKAADCGGCMPLFLSIMRGNHNTEVPSTLPMQLRNLRSATTQENENERRRKSNRIP